MDPATTRIEVLTELVESPPPVLTTAVIRKPPGPDIADETTIGLGSMQAIRGKAYPFPMAGVDAVDALLVTGGDLTTSDSGVSVVKQLHELPDGRRFILESVGWQEAEPLMARMVAAKKIDPPREGERPREPLPEGDAQVADSRVWPQPVSTVPPQKAMQLSANQYTSDGFLVDIDLSGSVSTYTFLSGTTYYIPVSFYIASGPTTFQPGCVVKYATNAWLIVHGNISCPPVGQMMPVLTSKDDNLFGAVIPGSTGQPFQSAAQALWIYYAQDYSIEVRNMRIRYAQRGIDYLLSQPYPGNPTTYYLRDSLFQQCEMGTLGLDSNGSITPF